MQEWIAERRMAEARRLLVETNLPVEEVGRRVGYGDPTYVAQPFGTYTQPLLLANAARGVLPKVMITNSFPLAQVKELIASEHPWFRELAGPEWRLLELPTGH